MARAATFRSRAIGRGTGASILSVGVLALTIAPAGAHVGITPSTTAAGAYAVLAVSVPHGCGDSPTTEVTIQMPDTITAATPTRHALWTVEKQVEKLDPPVTDSHGNQLTERVASITYRTDTPLPDGQREVFELSVQLPDAEGDTLVFPTVQTCEQGESAWIEVAGEGQDEEDLELPAPTVVIGAADADGHHGGTTADDVSPAAATTRGEAKASADADGTDALTVAALGVGVLGVVLGGVALVRQRRVA